MGSFGKQLVYLKINQFENYSDGHIIMDLCGWEWKDSNYSLEEIDKIVLKIKKGRNEKWKIF